MRRFCTGCRWWVHIKSKDCTDYSFWYCEKYRTTSYSRRKVLCGGNENRKKDKIKIEI